MKIEQFHDKSQRYKILKPFPNSEKVFLAKDMALQREVVLKKVTKNNPFEFERFKRELSFHAKLDHPYIVPIFDYFETQQDFTIVMKLVDGVSLKDKMKILNLEEFLEIFKKILQALAYVHSEKILHRDIKPSNILIDKENHPYLIDFGILKLLSSEITELTTQGTFLGTTIYASPEQFLGAELTPSSDIYSLGMVLYEKLSGKPLIYNDSFKDKNNPMSFTPKALKLPKEYQYLEKICLKMIHKNPQERYKSCQEILKDLERGRNMESSKFTKKDVFLISMIVILLGLVSYLVYSLHSLKLQISSLGQSEKVLAQTSSNQNLENSSSKESSLVEKTTEPTKETSKPEQEETKHTEIFEAEKPKQQNVSQTQNSVQVFYTTQEVNLREKPTQNSRKLKRLKKDVEVKAQIVEKEKLPKDAIKEFPWYYDIERKGYLYGKYLKLKSE